MVFTYLFNRHKGEAMGILDQAGVPPEAAQPALVLLERICIGIDVGLLLLVFFIIN